MFYIGGILENQDDVASWLAYIKKSPLRRLKKKRCFLPNYFTPQSRWTFTSKVIEVSNQLWDIFVVNGLEYIKFHFKHLLLFKIESTLTVTKVSNSNVSLLLVTDRKNGYCRGYYYSPNNTKTRSRLCTRCSRYNLYWC
jgi:hypothetical protein